MRGEGERSEKVRLSLSRFFAHHSVRFFPLENDFFFFLSSLLYPLFPTKLGEALSLVGSAVTVFQ